MTIIMAVGTMENIEIDLNKKLTQNDPESDFFKNKCIVVGCFNLWAPWTITLEQLRHLLPEKV